MSGRVLTGAVLLTLLALSRPVTAQSDEELSWLRAVGEEFALPTTEVGIMAEWGVPIEEVAVVLTVASRVGISPDAVASMRRGGRGWAELGSRYGLNASHFHLPLTSPPATVARAYESYAARSRSEWPTIRLEDSEVIFLVNASFLSRYAEVSPQDAAEVLERTGSGPAALRALGR